MNSLFGSNKTTMVAAADAMPGRDRYTDEVPKLHAVWVHRSKPVDTDQRSAIPRNGLLLGC